MATIRTFIGIAISEEIRQAASAFQKSLVEQGATAKWVPPADMHITLHFLGEMDVRDVPRVCSAVDQGCRKIAPMSVQIGSLGAFPNLRRPKTLWVGVTEGESELAALHEALREPLENAGVYRHENRRYTPHVTLGRCKAEDESHTMATILPKMREFGAQNRLGGRLHIDEVILYRSELEEYIPLGRSLLLKKQS